MATPFDAPPSIPDFRLIRRIGVGSYGEVWLAQGVTGMFRAVKVVKRLNFTSDRPYQREFEGVTRFVQLATGEPSQLAVLHAGISDKEGYFFYVMELADDIDRGRDIRPEEYQPATLAGLLQRRGHLDLESCVEIALAMATGLATLHRGGLVHRDIKPSNVVLVGGVPKLADIGLVALAEEGRTFVGTEVYTAPEGPGRPPADVFALSRVLYELWTGYAAGDWPKGITEASQARRDAAEWAAVLERAGAFVAAQRHPDGQALVDELLLVRAGRSVRRLRLAERTAVRLRRGLVAAALVGLVAGGAAVAAIRFERGRAEVADAGRRQAEAERDALARRSIYSAELGQAQRAIEKDDFGAARRHLLAALPKEGVAEVRGFEWHVLWHRAQGDADQLLQKEGRPVEEILLSSDGAWALVREADGHLVEWDLARGARSYVGEGAARLLSARAPGQPWLIQRTDGSLAWFETGEYRNLAVPVPAEHLMTVVRSEGAVLHLDPLKPSLLHRQGLTEPKATSISLNIADGEGWRVHRENWSVSQDGKWLALVMIRGVAYGSSWRVVVARADSGEVTADFVTKEWVSSVRFAEDGSSRVLALIPNALEVRSCEAGASQWQVAPLEEPVLERLLGVPGWAEPLLVRTNGSLVGPSERGVRPLRGPDRQRAVYAFGPDLRPTLVGDQEGRLSLWRDARVAPSNNVSRKQLQVGAMVAVSQKGRWAAVQDGSECRVVELATGELLRRFEGISFPLGSNSDESQIWLATEDGRLRLAPLAGTEAGWSKDLGAAVWNGGVSEGGAMVLVADERGVLHLIDDRGRPHAVVESGHGVVKAISPSREMRFWVTSGTDGQVRRWSNTPTGVVLEREGSAGAGGYAMIVASSDGRWLAGVPSAAMSTVEILDAETLVPQKRVAFDGSFVKSIAFSAESDRLVVSVDDGGLRVLGGEQWNAVCDLQPASLSFAGGRSVHPIISFEFTPSAPSLVGLHSDGQLAYVRW